MTQLTAQCVIVVCELQELRITSKELLAQQRKQLELIAKLNSDKNVLMDNERQLVSKLKQLEDKTSNETMESLTANNQSLTKLLDNCQTENKAMKDAIESLIWSNGCLKGKLEMCEKENKVLRDEATQSMQTIKQCATVLKKSNEEYWLEKVEHVKNENAELRKQVDDMKKRQINFKGEELTSSVNRTMQQETISQAKGGEYTQ